MEPNRVQVRWDDGPDDAGHEQATDDAGQPVAVLAAAPLAETQEEPKAPAHSTRGAAPGPRGCWALNRDGDPCAAPRRGDGDYCNAHTGLGVAKDPASFAAVGGARSAEVRRRRADLRFALGPQRMDTPRGVLKVMAFRDSERLAAAALDGAFNPAVPPGSRAKHALDLIREADPPAVATLSADLPSTPDGVASLSLTELLSVAQAHGLPLPPDGSVEPLGEIEAATSEQREAL